MLNPISEEAYRIVSSSGLVSKTRMRVYEFIRANGPCSQKDCDEFLSRQDAVPGHSGKYTSRFSELQRMGLIEQTGQKTCEKTGMPISLYDVVSINNVKQIVPANEAAANPFLYKLYRLGYTSYEEYLSSDHWTAFREEFWKTHPKVCSVTGAAGNVTLHHLNYECLGKETETDVFPVCWEIHQLLHEMEKLGIPIEKSPTLWKQWWPALLPVFSRLQTPSIDLMEKT